MDIKVYRNIKNNNPRDDNHSTDLIVFKRNNLELSSPIALIKYLQMPSIYFWIAGILEKIILISLVVEKMEFNNSNCNFYLQKVLENISWKYVCSFDC